ncbi:ATP-dependent Clp protease proteolytic subunit [Rhynchospora pubera]|uniref:ATP-dependent Clp protease proteolytic subunit n=2 Tax=Rhynchospora pubera TaxID=906938 RepID=A0AAV8EEU5_9POAL|nr:ATP-dependent Clp protease proteolytic subunit [Rhynchospora pubera]
MGNGSCGPDPICIPDPTPLRLLSGFYPCQKNTSIKSLKPCFFFELVLSSLAMALAFSCASRFSLSLDKRSFSISPSTTARERRVANGDLCGHHTVRLPSLSHFQSVRKSNRSVISMAVPEDALDFDEPPPDLASHLFRNRIVYLGLPLIPAVTELIFAQLIHLQYDDFNKPIYLYINSTGVVKNDERLGYETEAFALYDIMRTLNPPIFTLCVGNAWGDVTLLLTSGATGNRAALPSTSIMIKEPLCKFEGEAVDAEIAKKEIKNMKVEMVNLLAKHTGQSREKIEEDIKQPKYFTPTEAIEYGLIDKVLDKERYGNGVVSQLSRVKLL